VLPAASEASRSARARLLALPAAPPPDAPPSTGREQTRAEKRRARERLA